MIKSYLIYLLLFLFITVESTAQVGVGTLEPTADLDINFKVKLTDLKSTKDLENNNRYIISDEHGNLGYRFHYQSGLVFRNIYLEKMKTFKGANENSSIDLGLPITIIVPAKSTNVFEIFYSIPVINSNTSNIRGSASLSLTKNVGGKSEIIEEASREISFSSTYSEGAAAKGRPVSNTYFDKVVNDSDSDITIIYNLKGHTSLGATNVRFGMWNASKSEPKYNYNWGEGMFMISVFDIQ